MNTSTTLFAQVMNLTRWRASRSAAQRHRGNVEKGKAPDCSGACDATLANEVADDL
jgi:hypothetical protein